MWSQTRTWFAASGITIVTAIGFAGWAARGSEQNIIRPYVCKVLAEESVRLHAPLEYRMGSVENDTKIIRYIIEAGTSKDVIQSAVARAKDSTFRVR